MSGARCCAGSACVVRRCGEGRLFGSFLKVADRCPACGEELHHQRADDAPAYFTIVVVGHIIVGGVLSLERAYAPATWVHAVIWLPLTLIASLLLLPRVKGTLVGLQWALRMHGFGGEPDRVEPPPRPSPANNGALSPAPMASQAGCSSWRCKIDIRSLASAAIRGNHWSLAYTGRLCQIARVRTWFGRLSWGTQ